MKRFKISGILLLSLITLWSCDESEQLITTTEGGLIEVKNPSINYVVGNPGPYTANIRVFQGIAKTNKVEVYKTFHTVMPTPTTANPDSVTAFESNTLLFKTITIDDTDQNSLKNFQFTFNELRDGLTIKGQPLPASDGDYRIGDYWELQYHNTTSDNRTLLQDLTTKITIATRFAGKYRFVEGAYYRIHVLTSAGDYWDPAYLIESIDAKTYLMNGVCAWMDQKLYFQIDNNGKITYPAEWKGKAQLINDMPLITCESSPSDMAEVHCGETNYVIKDDVNGKDRLIMSFGYYTTGSGPRTFYQVMEKIVE